MGSLQQAIDSARAFLKQEGASEEERERVASALSALTKGDQIAEAGAKSPFRRQFIVRQTEGGATLRP